MRNVALFIACALGSFLFHEAAFGAARPATPVEAKVYLDAAHHLTASHVPVGPFRVLVTGPGVDECIPEPRPLAVILPYACALPETVYLSPDAARDARFYYRATYHASKAQRARVWPDCPDCVSAPNTALHELVHVARMTYRPIPTWTPSQYPYEEGLAEAVAYDQTAALVRRVTGLRGWGPGGYTYPDEVEAVARIHTTRRARLDAIRNPHPPPTITVPPTEASQ